MAASGEGMRKTRKRELESMAIANEQQEQWLSPDNGRGVGGSSGGGGRVGCAAAAAATWEMRLMGFVFD